MDFANRLRMIRLDRNLTQKDLGLMVGVSAVTVGNWERGIKLPNLSVMLLLSEKLNVSLDELAGSDRNPIVHNLFMTTPSERAFLEKYRALDKYGKQAVESICNISYSRIIADQETHAVNNTIDFQKVRQRYLPAYSSPSAAGTAVPLEGDEFEIILADEAVPDDADFAVRIQGDSMSPYINDGSMVFVNKDAEIRNGDVGIFCVDGSMYCKQYFKDSSGNVHLLSANPDRIDANVYLSSDSGSSFTASGKVILKNHIPLPDYFRG